MKRKVFSFLMVLMMTLSILPFGSIDADAFSTGAKTLIKTKTVTIKPGKTYKTPAFKLKKKMCLQIPTEIWISPKDKKKAKTIKSGNFKVTLYNSKGKKLTSFKDSLKDIGRKDESYDDWGYCYCEPLSKPGFSKGKYYFTIKNNTNRIIKVKYKVKGYTKFASKASLKKKIILGENDYAFVGNIGPGLPLISEIESYDPDIEIDFWVEDNGRLYIFPMSGTGETTLYLTMFYGDREYEVDVIVEAE